MKYLLFSLLVVVVGVWSYNLGALTPRVTGNDYKAVEAVCDYSHSVDSGEWEDACGTALDATMTTYECDSTGNLCNVKEQ